MVCIVSDGRAKINSRTLSVLAAMGVYQDGVAKNVVAGKPVTAHIYEVTPLSLSARDDADNHCISSQYTTQRESAMTKHAHPPIRLTLQVSRSLRCGQCGR